MNRSTIEEAGARIDSGGDYVMKEKNKEVETDARRLTSDVGEGDSIQPKRSKKCRESKITDRFEKFYAMQLLILKKMGVYIDEEDIEEFKDLIKDINEGLVLLEEDIKRCKLVRDSLKIKVVEKYFEDVMEDKEELVRR
ncbi:hypothetical protein H4Q26_010972 [Puccinia striiformis f. sp. tritici PST-130]|nr:hypothetical protein H4Q26_010972 [Puccinia striiformis f. sp. tritici PST-130]